MTSVWSVSYLARELKGLLGLEEGLGDLVQGGEQVRLFKWIVSRDEYYFEGPKFETELFELPRIVFTIFSCLFVKKFKTICACQESADLSL
jgi:hypothetical protein